MDGKEALARGQAALLREDFGTATRLFQEASERLGEAPEGALARYLYAQALQDRGDSPALALQAFQAFLDRDRTHASVRLVQVAEKAVHDLQARSSDWQAWTALEQTRRALQGRPYAERVAGWKHFLSGKLPDPVARAARTALAQEAMVARDWSEALRQWRVLVSSSGDADGFLREQLEQARQELRRGYLAVVAGGLLLVGLAGLLTVRPWRLTGPGDRRRGMLLIVNWTGLAWLLYALYQLGRRSGDISPVTWDRFLALWGALTLALLLGLGWTMAFRGRIPPSRLALASLAVGTLLCGSALYLFCYVFDYTSVLGL